MPDTDTNIMYADNDEEKPINHAGFRITHISVE